jgi:hypothetical protein
VAFLLSGAFSKRQLLDNGPSSGARRRAWRPPIHESRFGELSTTFTQPTLTIEQRLTDTLQLQARVSRATSGGEQCDWPRIPGPAFRGAFFVHLVPDPGWTIRQQRLTNLAASTIVDT